MQPKAVWTDSGHDRNICWKWECKDGLYQLGATGCVNKTECLGQEGTWEVTEEGKQCVEMNFCPGFENFNPLFYIPEKMGSCYVYRCKDGGFKSAQDLTCEKADPDGTFGGKYAYPDTGIIATCPNTQQVKKLTPNSGECVKPNKEVSQEDMLKCFRCTDSAKFEECIICKGYVVTMNAQNEINSCHTTEKLDCARKFDNDTMPSWF